MTMKKFEDRVRNYLAERGWDKLRPADLAKSIMIEGGELLEIFQWQNLSPDEVKAKPEMMEHIKKELADVMTYCFDMAVILGLDVEQIVNDKLDHVEKKYPKELFNKNSFQEPGTEDIYWEIKKSHRKQDNS